MKRVRQEGLWTPTAALPVRASRPFYQRLNQILDEKKFDEYVEGLCERFYADEVGRFGLFSDLPERIANGPTPKLDVMAEWVGARRQY